MCLCAALSGSLATYVMEINCLLYMSFSSAYSISLDEDEVAIRSDYKCHMLCAVPECMFCNSSAASAECIKWKLELELSERSKLGKLVCQVLSSKNISKAGLRIAKRG